MISDPNQYFSPDDSISLSLEYYQHHLDTTSEKVDKTETEQLLLTIKESKCDGKNENDIDKSAIDDNIKEVKCASEIVNASVKEERITDRRYLQCAAAVSMSHLQKFLRMKYALSPEHKVSARFFFSSLFV